VTTHGARFLQYQLVASDLDGCIEPTREYQDSLCKDLNDFKNDGQRYKRLDSDATSFMFNVQLERSGAGYCFDGLDTGGQNISIQLKGTPIKAGVNDTYYCVDLKDGADPKSTSSYDHPPNPECWICQETFWILSTDKGMEYNRKDLPPATQKAV
jgi:hypothetical protein